MENFHTEIWFEGHVQNVGFRASVMQSARGFDVTGIVQNLSDGRVFLHAEGKPETVALFLEEIRRNLRFYIHKEEIREYRAPSRYRDFRIAF